jgi:3-deoxy-D-manno-octulosonic acid kinase
MQLIEERCTSIPGGCILYDTAHVRKAEADLFDPNAWSQRNALEQVTGGRGSVAILRAEAGHWVLRHYCRGGLAAKVSKDRYFWIGADRTRSFAEWRLLARLRALELPVPHPIAARYVRHGLTYRADLITQMLENTITLAQALVGPGVDADAWREVGRTIASFHRHGVHHADLNAHNILLAAPSPLAQASSPKSHVHLLDFDRGRIRARGAWEEEVLTRLHRSLEKVCAQAGRPYEQEQWQWLMEGYRLRSERRTADGGR